jgi:hypothetical protein
MSERLCVFVDSNVLFSATHKEVNLLQGIWDIPTGSRFGFRVFFRSQLCLSRTTNPCSFFPSHG